MISKELLSVVINKKIVVDDISNIELKENTITFIEDYWDEDEGSGFYRSHTINIYELAHKCKEWANKQGILLRSSIDGVVDFYDFRINGEDKGEFIDCREFKCSEVEAVIQACQWILDNVKTNSLS